MNRKSNTFSSQNLVVDYLSFKFPQWDDSLQRKIEKHLFQMKFNSYQESGKLAKPVQEPLLIDPEHPFKVSFIGDHSYWHGMLLHFSGRNADRFYQLCKEGRVDWSLFATGVLARFDFYYTRPPKPEDNPSVSEFLQQSFSILKQSRGTVRLEKNPKGDILKIGGRTSNLYYRIYRNEKGLRFEHEIKGKSLQQYNSLLVKGQFQELEQELSNHFLDYSAKLLPFQSCYLDWLVIQLRPLRNQLAPKSYLNVHYLYPKKLETFTDRKDFLRLLQFLTFAKELIFDYDSLGTTQYREIIFPLQEFLKYQTPTTKSDPNGLVKNNHYQLQQLVIFFNKLQQNSLIQIFSDRSYMGLMGIPRARVEKNDQNIWMVRIWIAEEFFYYLHPFMLPNIFQYQSSKAGLEVQFYCLQVFTSQTTAKIFCIQEFFDSYPSVIANQQKTQMKQLFLDFVTSLTKQNLIEAKYQVLSKGSLRQVEKLTLSNISEGFIIYEKITL